MSLTNSNLELARLALNTLSEAIYQNNVKAGWFKDPTTGRKIKRDPMVMLMLIVTEVAEAAEGIRKDLPDDHIPSRPMVEVELADVLVRVFELAGYLGLDLGGAFVDKVLYNAVRADHKLTARAAPGGKKC